MREIAIEINDLCVDYRELKGFSLRALFREDKRAKAFRAVDHVTMAVPKGEIWGIIGKNGSGKSTLLNTIAGIFSANEGSIDLHGHSVSLLSIGVGFNKEISGRENIMLSGMLLGFSRQYILEKMDEIIAFSELERFIDKPVRTYSSGMYSKLAFSVTAILETEIMLIDEVLSVGDEHYRKKSLAKMRELIQQEDRTVIIVSHSITTLEELCDKVVWMHQGKIKEIGAPDEVLAAYRDFMK